MLKRYVSPEGLVGPPRSRMVIGVSFLLLVLVGSGVFLSSVVGRQQHAHAAKPRTTTGGVSKTWYFAEGHVGAGFREFITIGNPDPITDCTATITYMPEGDVSSAQAKTHMAARKPLAVRMVTVTHNSRYTASVNQDLGIAETQQPDLLVSTVVSVPLVAGCAGVVVERPMYFSYHGVTSGSDVMGTTNLAQTFFFADVPTKGGTSSFMDSHFTVLNPSQIYVATIGVTYYAAGASVGSQTLFIAPGARGTINPGTLPYSHVTAVVTSDITVAVERSSYIYNMQEASAGSVTSAATVVGAQSLSDSWHFAEGYTGGKTQENLLLSNPTGSATTATVTLEYQNTHHQTLTVPVPAQSEVPVDVNALNTNPTGTCDVTPCVTTPEVSAEVTASTSQSLVVERQMFFHYTHTIPGTSITTTASGGTEVQGTLTPATSVANFAEGYTNTGYNEWLTLQNPMVTDETLALSVVNEYGRVYTQSVLVRAKSRSTVDITALVLQHLVQRGDNYRGYQVSMSVQATTANSVFVAERPMYFNLSGSIQGGTDVVGFTGTYSCTELNTGLTGTNGINFMTVGGDGNLWVAENGTNSIGMITPFGPSYEYTVPTLNSGIEGITTDSNGNMWFTEYNGNKIGEITTGGTINEYSLTTANSYPEGIVKGSDGNLWFVERGNSGKIGKITTGGTITEYTTSSAADAFGMTLGADGNVWFAEGNAGKIGKITTGGTVTDYSSGITSGANIYYLTAGPDGNVWFTENNKNLIGKITTSGTVGTVTEYSSGTTASSLQGITTGPDGNLWFAKFDEPHIGVMTPTGTVTDLNVSVIDPEPGAMAVGSDNNIWFSDHESYGQIGRCAIAS